MNELLKELLPNPWAVDYQVPHDGRGFDLYDEKKMIEYGHRIVRECAKLAKDKSLSIVEKAELYGEPDEIDTAKATAWQFLVLEQQMKKHFGVE